MALMENRRSAPTRSGAALAVIAVAQLMTALDTTIVNIALPSAEHALGFDDGARQWVITAYTLCFAGLLLLGGRVADRIGRRRALLIGLGGFGAASLVAGLAQNLPVLVAGRALQGGFAALVSPTALSLLAVTFSEARVRARAFAVFGAVASSGAAAGLLVGGVLTEYLGWRWCLYVNVAVAAVELLVARVVLPDPAPASGSPIDVRSAVLATGGLAALVLGGSRAGTAGWSSTGVVLALAAGTALLAGFVVRQGRMTAPLLPLALLTDRRRAGAYLAAGTAVMGAFGLFLMLTYYLQVVRGYSPVRAGLGVVPLTVANAAAGYQLGHRLAPHVRARTLVAGGLLVAAIGLAWLSRLGPNSGYLTVVLPAEVLVGVGMGALFPPVFALAVGGVAPRDAGVASALVTTATQVGGSIGTAVLNTVAVTATADYLAAHRVSGPPVAGLVHGYATATGWSAALLAAAALAVFALLGSARPHQPEVH